MTQQTRQCIEHLDPMLLDGERRLFFTTYPYLPRSVYLFGPDLRPRDELCELGDHRVLLAAPPVRGDTVFLWYLSPCPSLRQ